MSVKTITCLLLSFPPQFLNPNPLKKQTTFLVTFFVKKSRHIIPEHLNEVTE